MFNKKRFLAILLVVMVTISVSGVAAVSAASYSSAHNSGPVKVVKSVTSTNGDQHSSVSSSFPAYDYEGRNKRIARAKALYAAQKLD